MDLPRPIIHPILAVVQKIMCLNAILHHNLLFREKTQPSFVLKGCQQFCLGHIETKSNYLFFYLWVYQVCNCRNRDEFSEYHPCCRTQIQLWHSVDLPIFLCLYLLRLSNPCCQIQLLLSHSVDLPYFLRLYLHFSNE